LISNAALAALPCAACRTLSSHPEGFDFLERLRLSFRQFGFDEEKSSHTNSSVDPERLSQHPKRGSAAETYE